MFRPTVSKAAAEQEAAARNTASTIVVVDAGWVYVLSSADPCFNRLDRTTGAVASMRLNGEQATRKEWQAYVSGHTGSTPVKLPRDYDLWDVRLVPAGASTVEQLAAMQEVARTHLLRAQQETIERAELSRTLQQGNDVD